MYKKRVKWREIRLAALLVGRTARDLLWAIHRVFGLRCAAMLDRLDDRRYGGGGGTGVRGAETHQDLVGGVLEARIGLVQLAGGLAGQLAKLIPVGHMRECPEN